MALPGELTLREHEGFHSQVATARLETRGRRSLVLAWSRLGQVFEGEASPLPGFGEDSFELARAELDASRVERLEETLQGLLSADPLHFDLGAVGRGLYSPSARFALEQCLLGALALARRRPVWALLAEALGREPSQTPSFLRPSALVDPLSPHAAARLSQLEQDGVGTIKIKLGRARSEELAFLATLRGRFRVRLDPNQSLRAGELALLLDALAETPLEFVEDPTVELDAWQDLARLAPLAIDEPLASLSPSTALLQSLGVRFLVLKPMALGGYSACLAWARAAAALGVQSIVSHLFDGPRALRAAIELAFAVQTGDFAPGLGLHAGLEAWPPAAFSARGFARPGEAPLAPEEGHVPPR
jgi:L-alanine-DL-glutamate epimerase-like enolase superfamily enzyme